MLFQLNGTEDIISNLNRLLQTVSVTLIILGVSKKNFEKKREKKARKETYNPEGTGYVLKLAETVFTSSCTSQQQNFSHVTSSRSDQILNLKN